MASWVPLESDPEVFIRWQAPLIIFKILTKYGHGLGMKSSYEFVDVLAFDLETMGAIVPEIYHSQALIFLYSISSIKSQGNTQVKQDGPLYFMKQTAENACGSVALIHVLANTPSSVDPSSTIEQFVRKTKATSAMNRGITLENDQNICALHASFSAQGQTAAPGASTDIDQHFVAFIEGTDGILYEMDGRQAGPITHAEIGKEPGAFFQACCETIGEKYLTVAPDAQFTAMALIPT